MAGSSSTVPNRGWVPTAAAATITVGVMLLATVAPIAIARAAIRYLETKTGRP